MAKKYTLSSLCLVASLMAGAGQAHAQFSPTPALRQELADAVSAAVVPDNIRLAIMVRNAVIALNQANWTGNYSVLRDMGTPSFQITNSSARLAEIFGALRAHRIDLTPVMIFEPKFTSAPAMGEGELLRLAGFFPTSPEQVNFELAFQRSGEEWLLAGIAVNTSPPGENSQSLALAAHPAQTAIDANAAAPSKPIRIDLSQFAAAPAKPAAPKKPAAVRKPKPHTQKAAAAQAPAPTSPAPPAAATPAPPAEQPAQTPAQAPAQGETAEPAQQSIPRSWNPFGR